MSNTNEDFFQRMRSQKSEPARKITETQPLVPIQQQIMTNKIKKEPKKEPKKKKEETYRERFANFAGMENNNVFIDAIIGAFIMAIINTNIAMSFLTKFISGLIESTEAKNTTIKGKAVLMGLFILIFIGIKLFVLE